jgi:hypothetical protein
MNYKTFDKNKFEAEVMRDVQGASGVVNPCTIFYTASVKVGGDQMTSVAAPWKFTVKKAKLDCMKYIEVLANRAFASLCNLKGLSTDENPDGWLESGTIDAYLEALSHEAGCHVDLNKGQYIQLRRLRTVEKTIRELL